MSESPYAIPAEELLTPVAAADQVEGQALPEVPATGWSGDPLRHADGGAGDADGD
ncbi:hypothetical protein [Blastococcus sp. LR1]|uniref:hypothetical protein n=1 Tax=Blastococcus sp. LR1 TaxID=2877000 RepID=UPI001CD03908|nr:hypothetical protein [Blastococcus sp. LR1]MCA0146676.1 hypothetical protein [Blastococcus sp. LR1]